MKFSHLEFKEVKGVGSIEVDFTPDKRVHAFIGENGVGKTKFLEALFQALFSTNKDVGNAFFKNMKKGKDVKQIINPSIDVDVLYKASTSNFLGINGKNKYSLLSTLQSPLSIFSDKKIIYHNNPIVFLAAQNRGFIKHISKKKLSAIGSFRQRRNDYIDSLFLGMDNDFSNLNMGTDVEQWFISIAQSSNSFQKKKDNREIEIFTVLKLCHQIDKSIDSKFMEIDGDNRVFLKINGEKTQLSHLSTGYASILKIIQSIISGYGYFTNEQQLQHVRGIVFIDEIESHLHLSWQSKIIPALKELFPNTIFYITTHSPVVLIQLEEGEAYRLQREEDGVVRSNIIHQPSNISFIDLQKRAFDLDLNKIKREQMSADGQKEANQALLDLMNEEAS